MAVLIFAAVFVSCHSGGGTAVTEGTGGKTNGTTDSPTTDRRHESGLPVLSMLTGRTTGILKSTPECAKGLKNGLSITI